MHIKNAQSALLSNHELLLHLRAEEAEYSGADGTGRERPMPSGLKYVLEDTLLYLSPPPDADIEPSNADDATLPHLADLTTRHPNRPMTLYKGPHSLFRVLSPKYRLNKAEYLQIYNLRPTTTLTLDLIVQESSTRFTEDEILDILNLIGQVFDEEEGNIPEGVEDQDMEKIGNKLLGAARKKRGGKRKA
ncbi:hypothetical protein K505DRAFT_280425 [Melanomma pulvis-pyrius CBS 109.77]|uniref:DNA-directed RNA polymerase III subunit RPC9 n=1 Tax=Melanomma pulvis-pyrius CBS 109.77 TaxID=1314802 RepID=A0A6A6X5G6_9PLEO|nr:hypothetical protein K505DRAFT_280425 [Melanomma pulvis-pyrius CBS 109.77]